MYPQADIPMVQLSIDSTKHAGPGISKMGRKLASLRDEGIMLVASATWCITCAPPAGMARTRRTLGRVLQ
ncbi:LigB family dioxygenase [Klebsiella pneumoniae]|uniref:LigB family dioxygenase n=1 Tax=Klebsiella pneumoniae TaxID=573 RepID=A0A2X3EWB2_KLEPN|nr:LigB family dioxygenase [Klebsiella pneumoniae]